jgi:Fur family ferric uptake transcriptional regulator
MITRVHHLRARMRFFDPDIEQRQTQIASERGFAIREHALYLYAECVKKDCPHRTR